MKLLPDKVASDTRFASMYTVGAVSVPSSGLLPAGAIALVALPLND